MVRKKYLLIILTLLVITFLAGCSVEETVEKVKDDKFEVDEYNLLTYEYLHVEKADISVFSEINSSLIKETERENGVIEDYYIVNPTSGAEMYVSVYVPENNEGKSIILVPGGIGSSDDFVETGMAENFMDEGFITVIFDAEGRELSSGEENYNGFVQQDGLYEIYRFVKSYDSVDEDNIGLGSFSYGVAMASGMLGRYQENVNIKYYIEWEGPTNRFYVTVGCEENNNIKAVRSGIDCNNEEYWQEREALRFVPYFNVDYFQVIQGENDHVQSNYMHSVEVNNLAVKYLDWVRVNDGDLNQLYKNENIPVIENYLDYLNEYALKYAKELSEK